MGVLNSGLAVAIITVKLQSTITESFPELCFFLLPKKGCKGTFSHCRPWVLTPWAQTTAAVQENQEPKRNGTHCPEFSWINPSSFSQMYCPCTANLQFANIRREVTYNSRRRKGWAFKTFSKYCQVSSVYQYNNSSLSTYSPHTLASSPVRPGPLAPWTAHRSGKTRSIQSRIGRGWSSGRTCNGRSQSRRTRTGLKYNNFYCIFSLWK